MAWVVRRDENGVVQSVTEDVAGVNITRNGKGWTDFLDEQSRLPMQQRVDLSVIVPPPFVIDPDLTLAVQILKTDIPASWKTSTNAQQRIAWAMRRVLIEVRN